MRPWDIADMSMREWIVKLDGLSAEAIWRRVLEKHPAPMESREAENALAVMAQIP